MDFVRNDIISVIDTYGPSGFKNNELWVGKVGRVVRIYSNRLLIQFESKYEVNAILIQKYKHREMVAAYFGFDEVVHYVPDINFLD